VSDIALPFGRRWPDGERLVGSVALDDLGLRAAEDAASVTDRPQMASWSFDELPTIGGRDYGDPAQAGWTVVVAKGDQAADATLAALAPLLAHRGVDASQVLTYAAGDELERAEWVDTEYLGLGSNRPRYLLLAGDPTSLPFELQATLTSAGASVGRVAFDQPEHLEAYVDKVIAHEASDAPLATQSALVWATDEGRSDPTHYSARYMAEPIITAIDETAGFTVTAHLREDATKQALLDSLSERPGLVFTASHGMVATKDDGAEVQRRVNGGWCCRRTVGAALEDWLLIADDLPGDTDAWPGSVVVQFACWGYGTPTNSTFTHWSGSTGKVVADSPFVAAIPKKLLANPKGPIAYVGHVDTAWLHGFADPLNPVPEDEYSPRLEPMLALVERALLQRTASAYGLRDLAERASTIASEIANTVNRLRRQGETVAHLDGDTRRRLADRMIRRNDAMWFLFYGDPGVRVRVGT
jgi:hypothetical protein